MKFLGHEFFGGGKGKIENPEAVQTTPPAEQVPPVAVDETAQQARLGMLNENLKSQQGQTPTGGEFKAPPNPQELWEHSRGEVMESQRPAAANMATSDLAAEVNKIGISGVAQTPSMEAPTPITSAPKPTEAVKAPVVTPFKKAA